MCTELCKFTTCDAHLKSPKTIKNTTMKISPVWISADAQQRIKPPPIPIMYDIINIKMRQNPSTADSETYKLKIITFEHGQPE